jgi:hypothetical protein
MENHVDNSLFPRMRKSMSVVTMITKPYAELLDISMSCDNFETKLERMIHWLNKIKQKLELIQDSALLKEIDWIIDTLLNGQLNDIVLKIQKNTTNEVEINKMLELLAEFSSEYNLQRDVENLHKKILSKKKSTMGVNANLIEIDDKYEDLFQFDFDRIGLSKNDIFTPKEEIFSKHFNIFNFISSHGRDETFYIVAGNIFNKYNLLERIKVDIFFNFITEIKNGYLRDNPYHNVK